MKTENQEIHPAVQLVADDLRKAYEALQHSQTLSAKKAATEKVLEKLEVASIVTQYTERTNTKKP